MRGGRGGVCLQRQRRVSGPTVFLLVLTVRRTLIRTGVAGLTAALLLRDVRDGRWAPLGKVLVRGHC
jgi:hypothetical protein